jgi:hypothetical protein
MPLFERAGTNATSKPDLSLRQESSKQFGIYPVLAGLCALLALLGLVFKFAMQRTSGEFVYPIDDSYIHLAIAKNLAAHGVWGVTRYEAAAASSSALWTVFLGLCLKVFGNNVLIPLLLNVVLASATFLVLYRLAGRYFSSAWVRTGFCFALVFALPGAFLIFSGMEHVLQCLLTIAFLAELLDSLEAVQNRNRHFWRLFILAILLTLTRYESLFLFLPVLLLAWRKRRIELVAPMIGGILAVCACGFLAEYNGLPFLPNTLMIKSDAGVSGGLAQRLSSLEVRFAGNFLFVPPYVADVFSPGTPATGPLRDAIWLFANVSFGALVGVGLLWKRAGQLRPLLFCVTVALLLHYAFADVRYGFGRYEAYLVVSFAVIFGLIAGQNRLRLGARAWAALSLFATSLIIRGIVGTAIVPVGMENTHDQQFQSARFVNAYFPEGNIAVIDVGTIGYYTDAHLLDLWGLTSNEVRKYRMEHTFGPKRIASLIREHDVDLTIVHPYVFRSVRLFPGEYQPVAQAKIQDNITCAQDRVVFFAQRSKAQKVYQSLAQFQQTLPPDVQLQFFAPSQ